ncbi:hypothetical protein COCON_G00153800 [Conger conger]|uniref:Putative WW-binding domain-containing protein n=1 Tax=Conger conger TaxID=82655 RepID=A0A9Q1D8S3_CONCO|nr:hypothetical protein COCON_G00153800 [Conger conger]
MTKRSAEDALFCDASLKRCVRSLCKIDAQLPGMAVAFGGNVNPPSLPGFAATCRKRAFCFDEQELPGVARPWKKSTTGCDNQDVGARVSGKYNIISLKHTASFLQENKPLGGSELNSPCRFSKKRMRNDSVGSQNVLKQLDKGTPADDDLSTFNSFQYWRVPLPEVDLSLLQTNGDAEELSQHPVKDSSMSSETDAMET